MDGVTLVFIVALMLFIPYLFTFRGKGRKKGKTMPGPSLISGMRDFLTASKNFTLHRLAERWARQFEDICYINLITRKLVFVNNADLFRKLVSDHSFKHLTNDRPSTFYRKFLLKPGYDLIWGHFGAEHKELRKIFHKALTFYGEGVGRFEDIMKKSLSDLKHSFKQNNENVPIYDGFSRLILGVLVALLTGSKTASEKETKAIKELDDSINDLFLFENEAFLQPFPALRFIPGLRFKRLFDRTKSCMNRFQDLFFEQQKNTYVPGEERGIVDQLLKAVESELENTSQSWLNYDVVSNVVVDTSIAAYLTTTNSLKCLFLQLVKYPHLQDRIHQEICQVVGRHGPLSFSDRARMPFTEAVILESFRFNTVIVFGGLHECREDVVFDGYLIEKGTTLFANAWHCHHDANKWEQPWDFRPERFLDADGQLLDARHPQRQKLITFGIGARSCPGESFARSRIFLVVVTLLQEFMFVPVASAPLPPHDPRQWEQKMVMAPENYSCALKIRE